MLSLNVQNVDELLPLLLGRMGQLPPEPSRNGPVLSMSMPVGVSYAYPTERFVMHPKRRNNPAFLVMEALWMLAGRNDVQWLARFNEQMREYSDNGTEFHGAYGHRLRKGFRCDQLVECAYMLQKDWTTRRAVASIWDPDRDLAARSRDIPCNDLVMFRGRQAFQGVPVLDMTVCNRSNDLVWGMCGANAAHFSYIHEYVAALSGMKVGVYTQISNNLHVYVDTPNLKKLKEIPSLNSNWYTEQERVLIPLCTPENVHTFDSDLEAFMFDSEDTRIIRNRYEHPFINNVALPLFNWWICRKYQKDNYTADGWRDLIQDDAILTLCEQWENGI